MAYLAADPNPNRAFSSRDPPGFPRRPGRRRRRRRRQPQEAPAQEAEARAGHVTPQPAPRSAHVRGERPGCAYR